MSASASAPAPTQPPDARISAHTQYPVQSPAQPPAQSPAPPDAPDQPPAPPAQPPAPPVLPPTYVFDEDLDHILTALVDLDLSGPNNLNVEILQYQGVKSFHQFEVVHPRDFISFTYLIPGGTITNRCPTPPLIHQGLTDFLYYCQHLVTTNNNDQDTPVNWKSGAFH